MPQAEGGTPRNLLKAKHPMVEPRYPTHSMTLVDAGESTVVADEIPLPSEFDTQSDISVPISRRVGPSEIPPVKLNVASKKILMENRNLDFSHQYTRLFRIFMAPI
jgi:hypothetical protein